MSDDYTLTTDDMPPADEAEARFPAEAIFTILKTEPVTDVPLWERPRIRERLLQIIAPSYRSDEVLQVIHDEYTSRIYQRPIVAASTVPTGDADVRHIPVYDSLTLRDGFDMIRNEDADLVITVVRCGDGQWRVAGFGDPARPEAIPRQ